MSNRVSLPRFHLQFRLARLNQALPPPSNLSLLTSPQELLWNAVAGENSTKNRHLKWVKGSGAWMNRSLTDFDIKRILGTSRNSKVFQATHYGHDCVLKEVCPAPRVPLPGKEGGTPHATPGLTPPPSSAQPPLQ